MSSIEVTMLVIFIVPYFAGQFLRDLSYRSLFESLKKRGQITGFVGPEHTWTKDERIVSGEEPRGSVHGGTLGQLKVLMTLVSNEQFTDEERSFVRRINIGQHGLLPLIAFVVYLMIKHLVVAYV